MKKVYYLATCSTCRSILKETGLGKRGFLTQDIKTEPITADQLDAMKILAGSYEALFSRKAQKFREWGLKEKKLEEKDLRQLILEEYTFLKRPVIVMNNRIFIGSSPENISELKKALS